MEIFIKLLTLLGLEIPKESKKMINILRKSNIYLKIKLIRSTAYFLLWKPQPIESRLSNSISFRASWISLEKILPKISFLFWLLVTQDSLWFYSLLRILKKGLEIIGTKLNSPNILKWITVEFFKRWIWMTV